MPLHHSSSTAQLWCGTVLHSSSICNVLFYHIYYFYSTLQCIYTRTKHTKIAKFDQNWFYFVKVTFFMMMKIFIYLFIHACWHSDVCPWASSSQAPLTLVIVLSGSSWPASSWPELTWQCYSSTRFSVYGVGMSRADIQAELKNTHTSRKGGGLGKGQCPRPRLTTHCLNNGSLHSCVILSILLNLSV